MSVGFTRMRIVHANSLAPFKVKVQLAEGVGQVRIN